MPETTDAPLPGSAGFSPRGSKESGKRPEAMTSGITCVNSGHSRTAPRRKGADLARLGVKVPVLGLAFGPNP